MNLCINTAYQNLELFLFNENGYEKLYTKISKNNHTIELYKLFEELLEKEKLRITDFQKIYIITGPGSYTGLRVGMIFAKTLAYEMNLLLYPISYLQILKYTHQKPIALDARGNKYFTIINDKELLVLKEELPLNSLIDPLINYKYAVKYLLKCQSQEVKEIKINYLKNSI